MKHGEKNYKKENNSAKFANELDKKRYDQSSDSDDSDNKVAVAGYYDSDDQW